MMAALMTEEAAPTMAALITAAVALMTEAPAVTVPMGAEVAPMTAVLTMAVLMATAAALMTGPPMVETAPAMGDQMMGVLMTAAPMVTTGEMTAAGMAVTTNGWGNNDLSFSKKPPQYPGQNQSPVLNG